MPARRAALLLIALAAIALALASAALGQRAESDSGVSVVISSDPEPSCAFQRSEVLPLPAS